MQFCLATYYFKDPRAISNVAAMDDNVEEIHLQRGDSWEAEGSLIRVPKYYSELEANPDQWVLHRYFLVYLSFSFTLAVVLYIVRPNIHL